MNQHVRDVIFSRHHALANLPRVLLPFGADDVPPGGVREFAEPTQIPIRVVSLVVRVGGEDFEIVEMGSLRVTMFLNGRPIPAAEFATKCRRCDAPTTPHLDWPLLRAGERMLLRVRNKGLRTASIAGRFEAVDLTPVSARLE